MASFLLAIAMPARSTSRARCASFPFVGIPSWRWIVVGIPVVSFLAFSLSFPLVSASLPFVALRGSIGVAADWCAVGCLEGGLVLVPVYVSAWAVFIARGANVFGCKSCIATFAIFIKLPEELLVWAVDGSGLS